MFYPLSFLSRLDVPAGAGVRTVRLSCDGEPIYTNSYSLTDEFALYGMDDIVRMYMHTISRVMSKVTVTCQEAGEEPVTSQLDMICTGPEFDAGSDFFESSFLLDCDYIEIPFIDFGDAMPGVGVVVDEACNCSLATHTAGSVSMSEAQVLAGVSVIPVPVPDSLPAMVAVTCGNRHAYLAFKPAIESFNRVILRWRNSFNMPVVDSFPGKITKNTPKPEAPVRVGNYLQGVGCSDSPEFSIEIAEITYDRALALSQLVHSSKVELLVPEKVHFSTELVDVPLKFTERTIIIKSIEGNISDSRSSKSSLTINFAYAANSR